LYDENHTFIMFSYGLNDRGSIPGRGGDFYFPPQCPDRLWGQPRLSNGYGVRGISLYPAIKLPERQADHSPPSSVKVENAWSYTSTTTYVLNVWCLMEHRILLQGVVLG